MTAVDSSVIIAGFGAWHEFHLPARTELDTSPAAPAHAVLEAYSVLTRLPEPFRADPQIVAQYLERSVRGPRLALPAKDQRRLPAKLASLGIAGGAVYDALVGLTATSAGHPLCTLDRRATGTYERCGVGFRLLT